MYNNNQSITIEVATPISQEQGTEVFVDWTELASLDNYDAFRMEFDDILGITAHGEAGKNGVIYVDLEGNHTNNSTLYYAFANAKFRDTVWNDSDKCNEIINAAQSIYTDVEGGKPALLAAYNAYFNLLNDSEPGYANMYSTITRLEAMSMIFKADTPVYQIEVNEQFASTVGNEQLAPYAQEMNDYSFLKADNLSLDSTTANGTITRGEFVYMIVQRYFADDYAKVTGKESCYGDAKNGGDVATKIGLIKTDKKTGVTSAQNRCESYELSYCLQDEKAGIPEEIYKALVVAQQKGLITGSECRWSDGIIKGEALTILTNAYSSMNTITSADRGTSSGEVINNENPEVEVIAFEDVDPATHATYNAETGEITADDTMVNTLMEKSAFFDNRGADKIRLILPIYLEGYFTGRYDGNAWYQFVLTGDTSYLNFEISDADLMIMTEQAADAYVNSDEFKNSSEYEDYIREKEKIKEIENDTDSADQFLADSLGITLEELRERREASDTGNTGAGNGGGGSTPVANQDTDQSNATENTFVTPIITDDEAVDNSSSGTSIIDFGAAADRNGEAAGDGGPLTGDTVLNAN